ncbi:MULTISPECIES: FAD-dependent oxidoreductase [Citricoccus]|uniref:FAD-dependent oxidoreductase n=1 Tax=Citricoccus TaxID=169133 RepID=UPI000255F38B|nr:FAD-dependent oxidoreductase [Citricoccus sp. CH26A]
MSGTCVVVGGGPAGMVLGLLLARAGIEVTVLEKHGDFLRDFRGDTVHPSTLTLLEDLGLFEAFDALPQTRLDGVGFPAPDGSSVRLVTLGRLRVPHPYIAMVPQWDLLDLLARAAGEEPTIALRMSTEAVDVLREGGGVTGVRYRSSEGAGELRADLVVACDGRGSILRRAAGLPVREYPVPFDVWWFRRPALGDPGISLLPRFRAGAAVVAIPRRGYFQVAYLGRKGGDAGLRRRGVEALRRELRGLLPPEADVGALTSMDQVKHLDVRVDRLRRWHTDGLLCIGDAAHAMSPVGGVGINLAVQDAVATARLLAPAIRAGRVRPRVLARVRHRRLMPTALIQAVQRVAHARFVEPVLDGTWAAPSPWFVSLVRRFPALTLLPAYLIGVGPLPERAPDWARRPSLPKTASPAHPVAAD